MYQLKTHQNFKTLSLDIDCYLLDLNAIIHPICQDMYGYGKKDEAHLLRDRNKPKYVPTEKEVYAEVCNAINFLRRIVRPKKQLMIAIDGAAGLSKQAQQRQRRFKAVSEKKSDQQFDSNQITTGSEFMSGLSRFIHTYIQRQLERNPEWKDLEVVFSNEKVPGEGEHNCLDYIKRNTVSQSFCVHSPDADLIMLTLSLPKPIYILRENIYHHVYCDYFIIDVHKFRDKIVNQMMWMSLEHTFTREQCIWDFILVCFLLGNDFLPHIPSLEIGNEGLEQLLYTYPRVTMEYGHFVYRNDTRELCINIYSLTQLFIRLAVNETESLTNKATDKRINFPDLILSEQMVFNTKENCIKLDLTAFKKAYYTQRLHGADIQRICHEYLKGMLFVLRYYIDGIPDWYWFYPFHYAPFFSDMLHYAAEFNGEMKFIKHTPLSPFEQLLGVLPPQSANILPEACRGLLTSPVSPIADFYPVEFKIDIQGKRQEWEGHAILPFIDVSRLRLAYRGIEKNLSTEEVKRNATGKNIKYFNDKTGYCRVVYFV